MSARSILLIAAALLLVVGTVFVARAWLDSQRVEVAAPAPAPVKEKAVRVLVAEVGLPAGTFLKEEHMRWQPWPSDTSIPETYLTQEKNKPEDLYGAVIRRGIGAGEPITRPRIIKPGDRGFMAAVLTPGYRAMSIKISAVSGVAGLIFPGDRVDIILTHNVKKSDGSDHRASETLLENVRVLALDSRVDDEAGKPKVAKTSTMELTPKQVEILTVAQELGRLSLSLRALAKDQEELDRLAKTGKPLVEPQPKSGKTYTWDAEASALVRLPKRDENVVTVVRGTNSQSQSIGETFDLLMEKLDKQEQQMLTTPKVPTVETGQ
jgi:pilus assembly protein CpaB